MWMPVSLFAVFFTLCQAVKITTDYLDEAAFATLIQQNDPVLAIIHEGDECSAPICEKFNEVVPVITQELTDAGYKVAASSSPELLKEYNIKSAEIVFIRNGRPAFFKGTELDADTLIDWLQQALLTKVQQLNEDDFEHLTQAATGATTGDWFVVFHNNEYTSLEPIWESLAIRLKGKAIAASVDTSKNTALEKRFSISKSPTLVYFRLGNMYTYSLSDLSFESLAAFAEGWYKNEKAVKVPLDPTPFDEMTDKIAKSLKAAMDDPKDQFLIIGAVGGAVAILAIILVVCALKKSKPKAD